MSDSEEELEGPQTYWTRAAEPRLTIFRTWQDEKSSTDAVEACRRLEDEVLVLLSIVSAVQQEKNAFVPINRLPAEVLLQCFSFLLDIEPPGFQDENKEDAFKKSSISVPEKAASRTIGWIKVTHVCHHWRKITIAYPGIWTTLTDDLPDALYNTMLERTGDEPLLVQQDLDTPTGRMRAENFVLHHLNHVRELRFRGSADALQAVAEEFSQPAPILEVLELICNRAKGIKPGLVLHSSSFSKSAPRLQSVSLRLLPFPESCSFLQNVTNFCFELEERNPALPSVEHLQCDPDETLAVLDCMPLLENLRLHHAFLHTSDTDDMLYRPPSRLVKLFYLQTMDLRNTYIGCIVTLKGLRIPSSCRISLEFHSYTPRTTEEVVPLLNVALIALDDIVTGHLPTFRALRINVGNDFNSSISARGRMLSILGWRTPIPEDRIADFDTYPYMDEAPPDMTLDIKLGARPLKCRDLLQKVFGYWDMRTVDTLSVRFPNRTTGAEFWYDLALHFKNIRHLVVEVSKLTPEIMRLILLGRSHLHLQARSPPASPIPTVQPTFESLHFPVLAYLAFRDHATFPAVWWDPIASVLMERKGKDGAFALQTLSVPSGIKTSTPDASLDELRNIGVAVRLRAPVTGP